MSNHLLINLKSFFYKGHQRTLLAKKNIALSFFLKLFSIIIMLLLVPLTIKYIHPAQYGIWLTLSSIISWMSFFDIGLGNGLKNKLAASNALDQTHHSRIFVSTTYALLLLISGGLLLIFALVNPFIHWQKILNTGPSTYNLNHIALLVFALFCVQFVVQIVNTVLTACHAIAKVSLVLLISQLLTLIAVFLLMKFTRSSLFLLVLVNGGMPVACLIGASWWYYKTEFKAYSPSFNLVDFKFAGQLLGTGSFFFVIQVGALVLFQTDNIVIVQLFGPAEVTTFNIAYKLFSVFIMGFNIIVNPLWSAFTEAYAINDLDWIKRVLLKMKYFWIAISAGAFILYLIAPFIYRVWLNNTVSVPGSLSLAMALYICAYTWQTIHVYFLNGINKIRLQLYLVILTSLINIPLAIWLGRKIGLAGVTFANAGLFIIMGIIFSYQTNRILNKKATGIWNS